MCYLLWKDWVLHIDKKSGCLKQGFNFSSLNQWTNDGTSFNRGLNKCVYSVYGQGEIRGNLELYFSSCLSFLLNTQLFVATIPQCANVWNRRIWFSGYFDVHPSKNILECYKIGFVNGTLFT